MAQRSISFTIGGSARPNTNAPRSAKLSDMPTIGRIGSCDAMIFRNDHDPPHFHVFGGEFSAKFAIADGALL